MDPALVASTPSTGWVIREERLPLVLLEDLQEKFLVVAVLNEYSVRVATDSRSYQRGQAYFAGGHVQKIKADGKTVTATVAGSRLYRVRLAVGRGRLGGSCTCPYGEKGMFCKHCVATALAWLDGGAESVRPSPELMPQQQLERFLHTQETSWLVAELLKAADTNPLLRARLESAAGAQGAFDDQPLRERLEEAIEVPDYLDEREEQAYFHEVVKVLDEIADLVGYGFADTARGLVEFAFELLDDVADELEEVGGDASELLGRAAEIHLAACEAGEPDQEQLAQYLVDTALASDHGAFLDALPAYAGVLGATGLARYGVLVREAYAVEAGYVERVLLEHVAESEGGTDALIDVLAQDVSSAHDVFRIALRLCHDDRDDEALEWLTRGVADFPADPDLRSLAAECHVRAGRPAEAAKLLWGNFRNHPSLDNYIALATAAADEFAAWRRKALDRLAKDAPLQARFTKSRLSLPGRSRLVEVLLWEQDLDGAWQAANAGGCSDELWLRLARKRAAKHPSDAIPVLLAAANQAIGWQDRAWYARAAEYLTEARPLFKRVGRTADFKAHMTALRATHKPKRALREELDRAGLP
ncbi:SWIM zinc finger domain-containing protein [Amycolatopsis sp. NPDC059027]|uniref:SWIM zinc finger family protein n=1 Tax=unclassified Amycolatopsis TaxID=2618356 RepID=UPI00366AB2DF